MVGLCLREERAGSLVAGGGEQEVDPVLEVALAVERVGAFVFLDQGPVGEADPGRGGRREAQRLGER